MIRNKTESHPPHFPCPAAERWWFLRSSAARLLCFASLERPLNEARAGDFRMIKLQSLLRCGIFCEGVSDRPIERERICDRRESIDEQLWMFNNHTAKRL